MNRRSLFKSLTAAIVASSMEVMGWKGVAGIPTTDPKFNPADWQGEVKWESVPFYKNDSASQLPESPVSVN